MVDLVEGLQELGFSEVEARVYLALLAGGPQSGYQAARAAAVQRPNVYPALERLERRGAVARVPGPSGGVLYAAAPFEQLAARLERAQRERMELVRRELAQLPNAPRGELPPTTLTQGHEALLGALTEMADKAVFSLVVALCPPEAAAVGDQLSGALARGVRVGVVCLSACEAPCRYCAGQLVRSALVPNAEGVRRWAVALRDGQETLIGDIAPTEGSTALRTRQPALLAVAAGFLRHVSARGTGDESGLGEAEALLAELIQRGQASSADLPQ